MPTWLLTIFAILLLLVALFMVFCMEGLMFAGMPNSSPEQLRYIQRLMIGFGAATGAVSLLAIGLMIAGRMGPSMACSGGVCLMVVGFFSYLMIAS